MLTFNTAITLTIEFKKTIIMKSITKFICILGVSLGAFFTSCTEEDILEGLTSGCVSLSAIENYSNALERYSANTSSENCEALKAAAVAYLDSLKDCPLIEDADLQEALQGASERDCAQ